jgi:nucleoside phosphorylase
VRRRFEKFDCMIATALGEEWHALCSRLKDPYEVKDTPLPAKAGTIASRRVLCILTGKGQENAASSLQRVLDTTPISLVLLVGIAGGLTEKNVRKGDVVYAQFVYGFDFGKLTEGKFIRRPELDFSCDRGLLAYAETIATDQRELWTSRITLGRPDRKPAGASCAMGGYIGSSGKVVDDPTQCLFEASRQHIAELSRPVGN